MAVLFDAFSLLQLNQGSKPGDEGEMAPLMDVQLQHTQSASSVCLHVSLGETRKGSGRLWLSSPQGLRAGVLLGLTAEGREL